MNLLSPFGVRSLLARHGARPVKRFGQNYLIDRNVLNKIVEVAQPAGQNVLEIGAGLGTVTAALAESAQRVVAVEKDARLLPVLTETLAAYSNIEIVHADFLKLELGPFLEQRFGREKCVVVSNLPYYVTSPIIARLVEQKVHFSRMVLMVQKEVAGRLGARPGTEEYGAISVLAQYHCRVEIAAPVSRNVFHPVPEVDSTLVVLHLLSEPSVKTEDEQLFFRIVRAAFGKRRKTVWNALTSAVGEERPKPFVQAALQSVGIHPVRRGETLSLGEFARLADALRRAAKSER